VPLRILHVIPAVAPRYGGPSVAVLGMCRALDAAGVPTLVAATDADGPGRLSVEVGRETVFGGVRAIFFRRQCSESFKWGLGLSRWLTRHVSDFDVVHVHAVFSHSSIAAGRACSKAGIPYIVRPLGTLDPWSVNRKALRKRALLAVGARRLLTAAAAIHYTTDAERRLAESTVPGLPRAAIVPLGIDDAVFVSSSGLRAPARPPYVLSFSRLDPKKGLDLLVAAFGAASEAQGAGDWRLVIAGDGEPAFVSKLRAQIAASPARDRIDLQGWVDGSAKRDLLRGASVMVAPSHQENFGISIVEAMASGTPVLVTPGVNLAAEITSAGAGWTVERSAAAVAEALVGLMSGPSTRETARARARAFADRFTWGAVAASLRTLYEDVAAGGVRVGTPPDARHHVVSSVG